jgi:hypothetical protein
MASVLQLKTSELVALLPSQGYYHAGGLCQHGARYSMIFLAHPRFSFFCLPVSES